MKNVVLTIGVVLGVILFSSCLKRGPEDTVKKFCTHFYKMEYDKIQNYVLPDHRSYYARMSSVMNELIPVSERKKMAKTEVDISNIVCETSGDTAAICSCVVTVDNQEVRNEELKLRKVSKTWLVDKGMEYKDFVGEENTIMDINDELLEEDIMNE